MRYRPDLLRLNDKANCLNSSSDGQIAPAHFLAILVAVSTTFAAHAVKTINIKFTMQWR
jgi:hypothetical protein